MSNVTKEEVANYIFDNRYEMLRFALSIVKNTTDAEDVVSDAIVKALEKSYQLKSVDKIKSWTTMIVANCAKDLLRKKKRVLFVNIEDVDVEVEVPLISEQDELWHVIQECSLEHRLVLVLYYYDGFSVEEISKILKIPTGTVKSRLARGREKISKELNVGGVYGE